MSEYAFEWEQAAMRGDPMPDGLPLEEQLAFQALAHLYARFRLHKITREAGREEKGKILSELERNRRRVHTQENLVRCSVEMVRAVESAANTYAGERTVEHADRLYEALYRVPPGKKVET